MVTPRWSWVCTTLMEQRGEALGESAGMRGCEASLRHRGGCSELDRHDPLYRRATLLRRTNVTPFAVFSVLAVFKRSRALRTHSPRHGIELAMLDFEDAFHTLSLELVNMLCCGLAAVPLTTRKMRRTLATHARRQSCRDSD